MTHGRLRFLALLAFIGFLPVGARLLRGPAPTRCAADGVVLDGAPSVRLQTEDGNDPVFCSVRCAEQTLASTSVRGRILVVDEVTGQTVDAESAWFVRSRVVAQPANGDRVHVFATREAAEAHAEAWRGRLLIDEERPLARR